MYMVIGVGANSVEVPCLWFSTKEAADAYVAEHGEVHEKGEGDLKNPKKFFTHYYNGCGGCYGLRVERVPEGVPFVGFNLD